MPSRIDWVTLADSLRKEYGALSMTEEQLKRGREQAKLKKQELDIDRGRLEHEIRTQAMKDAVAWDQIMHPEKYGVPPAVQTKKVEAEIVGEVAETGRTEAEIETEKTKPAYYKALTESAEALAEQREEGGADAKLSLATIETQITQTLKQMTPEVADMSGKLLRSGSLDELNKIYTDLKPTIPEEYMGMENSDKLFFDRLYDLLIKRFQYTTKPVGETVTPTGETGSTGLSLEDQRKIDAALNFK